MAPVAKKRNDFFRAFQYYLDKSTLHTSHRWLGTLAIALIYLLRVYSVQGFYIVTYGLGIYLLNLLVGFLSPKINPEMEAMDGASLPLKESDEFKPFIRRLPDFKFWYAITKAFLVAFVMTVFSIFDVPVFWPILLFYWAVLFLHNEAPDYAYDQVQIHSIQHRKEDVWWKKVGSEHFPCV